MTDETTERQDLSVGPLFSEDALQRLRSELSFRMMMDPLIAACDEALNWADRDLKWSPISTAPRDGRRIMVGGIQPKSKTVTEYWWYEEDAVFDDGTPCVHKTATHWMPIQNPPLGQLPAPLEALGAVLRRVKGVE